MNDPTDAYERDEPYEWDYEDAEDQRPRIMWGRLISLIVLVVASFLLGRATTTQSSLQDELDEARAEAEAAEEEVRTLEQQLAAEDAEIAIASPSPTAEEEEEQARPRAGRTYIVKSGDTLAGLALRFYGDSSLDDLIAEANDIEDPSSLSVGMKLIIPPDPND